MTTCASCGYEAAEAFRFCPECGAEAGPSGREQRKVVTVLFCDVVGSTALGESRDPEAVRALLARYFDRSKAIVERHGGTVEKFIGDAVMAVFGVPSVREDDALRAVRAAAELRAALPELGIEGRIGVNTGEVVTGTAERLATGDAVNVAARLEQAAGAGEIFVGEPTLRLVQDAVEVEPVEPLTLKGKVGPVPAWRLVTVAETAAERRLDQPLVGRRQELAALDAAWERVRSGPSCELVTIVGAAGVGKSRLAAEFLVNVDATVVRGRCLSYGEGITYWPVVEVIKQLEPRRGGLELDPLAAEALGIVLGEEGTSSTDEIAWAFRKLLEAVAAEEPIVVVFDDIHWGEDVFLDLVEHVAFLSTGAPVLLLCMARPELLDRRSGWSGVARLQPLSTEESVELMDVHIAGLLNDDVRERILASAGGNPLFVEEMAAMVEASGDGDVEVPPTIQALLSARLDQLETPERTVLERGSVEGELFHQGAVRALSPNEQHLTTRLTALVRKELVRPDRALLAGEDAFRFRHLLIRDAAYDSLPKAERAALHEQFADWLAEHAVDLVELDELLGYHLEQAHAYRQELGQADSDLAARAGERLRVAGSRAIAREDFRAAVNLLERAAELLPGELRDGRFEVDLCWARFSTGRGAEAVEGLAEGAKRAEAAGDSITALGLRLDHAGYELVLKPTETGATLLRELAEEALPVFEAADDEWGLTVAWSSLVLVEEMQGSRAGVAAAAERVIEHAQRADFPTMSDWAKTQLLIAQYTGATPVEECLRWLDEHPEVERRSVLPYRDRLLAMHGRFDEAHRLLAAAGDRVAELGLVRFQIYLAWRRFDVAMLEGDLEGAEAAAREACEGVEETGERGNYMMFCCNLAQALIELGRDEEAEQWLERGRETTEERLPHVLWHQAWGKLHARRGELAEGKRLARRAVAIAGETDRLNVEAGALVNLAEVLTLAGQDGRAELAQALALYERKGNLVMAERTRSKLA
ncbi:MAG TPA: adenylate/guanylate cyclase domain-containing protein [Gaiellaceae bacterium]|nr:adenylate/guanylate cyclase domain-containing protein [Gaiellaceae bacterium]